MRLGADSDQIQEQINKLFSSILTEQQKFSSVTPPDGDKTHLMLHGARTYIGIRKNPYQMSHRAHHRFRHRQIRSL